MPKMAKEEEEVEVEEDQEIVAEEETTVEEVVSEEETTEEEVVAEAPEFTEINVEEDVNALLGEEEDPRAELIRRLKEYELVKQAAEDLDIQPRLERDIFTTHVELSENVAPIRIEPDVSLAEIVLAFSAAMKRAEAFEHHTIAREALSTRERMSLILSLLTTTEYTPLERLFTVEEGKAGVVVCFLAILELVKEQLILCIQAGPYAKIHVKLGAHEEN